MTTVVHVLSLNDGLHGIKLHVCVIQLWQGRANNSLVHFVVLDDEGGAIQGRVPAMAYPKFHAHLAEGGFVSLRGSILVQQVLSYVLLSTLIACCLARIVLFIL